jgi:hypothetical protein
VCNAAEGRPRLPEGFIVDMEVDEDLPEEIRPTQPRQLG